MTPVFFSEFRVLGHCLVLIDIIQYFLQTPSDHSQSYLAMHGIEMETFCIHHTTKECQHQVFAGEKNPILEPHAFQIDGILGIITETGTEGIEPVFLQRRCRATWPCTSLPNFVTFAIVHHSGIRVPPVQKKVIIKPESSIFYRSMKYLPLEQGQRVGLGKS